MENKTSEIIAKARQYEEQLPPVPSFTPLNRLLATYLDCALHDPDSTPEMVEQFCCEARENQIATVFINPIYVPLTKRLLDGSGVHVGTVAGFPLGGFPTRIKLEEARFYLSEGADEIDMVLNVGMLKSGEYEFILDEISQMAEAVHQQGGLLKVILEMVLLTRFEKIAACLLAKEGQADFVKTSTGFSKGGATAEDVDLMRRVVGPPDEMGVKGAGGIRSLETALAMIDAGADRLGTRLATQILQEYQAKYDN